MEEKKDIELFINKIVNHPLIKTKLKKEHQKNLVNSFKILFNKYKNSLEGKLDWEKLRPLEKKDVTEYKNINSSYEKVGKDNLDKVIVIRLNGGMGTSMGCLGAKCVLKVDEENTFLSKIIKQHEYNKLRVIFMNSFNTDKETKEEIKKLSYNSVTDLPLFFDQNLFPRIDNVTKLPLEINPDNTWDKDNFNPPGHADIFRALHFSGLLEKLIKQGYEYAFIPNIDNLSAVVDQKVFGYILENDLDFVINTTTKTMADVKGGTLVRVATEDGDTKLSVLERAQCPENKIKEFENINTFKVFNTNVIWVKLTVLLELINKIGVDGITSKLPLIVNLKHIGDKESIQLEQAMGSAISLFKKSCAINFSVEDREKIFFPVKKTEDFFRLISDYCFIDENGFIYKNPKRDKKLGIIYIELDSKYYKKITDFLERVDYRFSLVDAESVIVKGDFKISKDVKFVGDVTIINETPKQYVLANKILSSGRYVVEGGELVEVGV